MAHINTELLIEEIEKRPILWDASHEEHSNRFVRIKSWEEVVDALLKNVSDHHVDRATKNAFEIAVQKKWKGIRGCYTRELARQRAVLEGKSDYCTRKSPYVYFDRLKFLSNSVKHKSKDDEAEKRGRSVSTSSNSSREDSQCDPGTKRIKNEIAEFEVVGDPLTCETSNSIDKEKKQNLCEEDEDKMFLMSLLSALKRVPENKKLETRIRIMTVINEATQ